ncbi:hypothetical protein Tco_0058412 [Tanacetum coccineum]
MAENRLNVQEGCPPVRQKKRGQAPERNKAIQEEVEKLVDAEIMKEVHYHSWLSNPVMVKKHDGSCFSSRLVDCLCIQDLFRKRSKLIVMTKARKLLMVVPFCSVKAICNDIALPWVDKRISQIVPFFFDFLQFSLYGNMCPKRRDFLLEILLGLGARAEVYRVLAFISTLLSMKN